jgi:hypothetical protein
MKNGKIDWSSLTSNPTRTDLLRDFAAGQVSGTGLYNVYKGTENAGTVRNMLRVLGVDKVRQLARKALSRRGVTL